MQIKTEGLWGPGKMVFPAVPGGLDMLKNLLGLQSHRQDANGAPETVAVGQDSMLAMFSLSLP